MEDNSKKKMEDDSMMKMDGESKRKMVDLERKMEDLERKVDDESKRRMNDESNLLVNFDDQTSIKDKSFIDQNETKLIGDKVIGTRDVDVFKTNRSASLRVNTEFDMTEIDNEYVFGIQTYPSKDFSASDAMVNQTLYDKVKKDTRAF